VAFWLNLQLRWDLYHAGIAEAAKLKRTTRSFLKYPLAPNLFCDRYCDPIRSPSSGIHHLLREGPCCAVPGISAPIYYVITGHVRASVD